MLLSKITGLAEHQDTCTQQYTRGKTRKWSQFLHRFTVTGSWIGKSHTELAFIVYSLAHSAAHNYVGNVIITGLRYWSLMARLTIIEAVAGWSINKQAAKLLHHLLCWSISWLESCCLDSLWKIKTSCENGGKKKKIPVSSKTLHEPHQLSLSNHHAQEQLLSFHTYSDRQISVNDSEFSAGEEHNVASTV